MSRHSTAWGIFAGALTALLWVVSIPPFEFAEAAYITFVPLLLWLSTKPARRVVTWVSFGTGLLAWCAILIWLRHVTIFGTLALSAVLAAYFVLWMLFARLVVAQFQNAGFFVRLSSYSGQLQQLR